MRDKGIAVCWGADEGLVVGPRGLVEKRGLIAIVVDQVDGLAGVGQSIADGPIVGIDGAGKPRRPATAEEDDVRAGFNDGVAWEAEVITEGACVT